jgi:hypothetical protein
MVMIWPILASAGLFGNISSISPERHFCSILRIPKNFAPGKVGYIVGYTGTNRSNNYS